ncbi:hypothetical protein GCM10010411_49770 [Actinomadura fulvescens]|uniref:Terminase small subunit n=2 Tax=Actinomadura fulvescens TaxID=46160 RepID=A0ABN3Q3B8_9ACTN
MATKGPVPKRSDQRRRRNENPEGIPTTEVPRIGATVDAPPLGFVTHDLAMDFYASLARSEQAHYFEPSDWQAARILTMELGRMLNAGKPSGQLYTALWSAMGDLLATEGQRRRLRFEIDRTPSGGEDKQNAAVIDLAKRLGMA